MLNVCLLTCELPPWHRGGIGTYVGTLAGALHRLGHQVTVVGPGIHPQRVERHGWGESIALPIWTWATRGSRALALACARIGMARCPYLWRVPHTFAAGGLVAEAIQVRQFLKTHGSRFDIVEAPNYRGLLAFSQFLHGRAVVRLSTPGARCGMGNLAGWMTWLEARTCDVASAVISNSWAMRDVAIQTYAESIRNVCVIPHGLDDAPQPGVVPQQDELVVSYIGRAEPRKGTDLLLRALPEALERDKSMRFRFVGCDLEAYVRANPQLASSWERLRKEFGDRIELLGKVPDEHRDAMIASSHWVIIPSRFESFGLVAVEAMRVGTPVIAADAGGLGEVARAGECNVVFPPEDSTEITNALSVVGEIGIRGAMLRRPLARQTYEAHFTSELMAKRSVAVYESVVSGSESTDVVSLCTEALPRFPEPTSGGIA